MQCCCVGKQQQPKVHQSSRNKCRLKSAAKFRIRGKVGPIDRSGEYRPLEHVMPEQIEIEQEDGVCAAVDEESVYLLYDEARVVAAAVSVGAD
jgi:hypothetical protein